MIDLFLSLLLISIVCLLIWCYTQKIRFKTLENIPGPKPYPIIGNMLYFHTNVKESSSCISAADERFKEYSDIYKHIHHGSEIVISRAFSYWKWLEILFRFHPDYRRSKIFVNYTSRLTRMLMNERRQILQDNCRVKQLAEVDALEKKNGYLDTMLRGKIDEKPLADTEIMEELITVLAAGIETTALWISFALYELSRNPDIQDRVVQEIRGIFGDNKNHRPSFQDYSKMTYTELVLKEVLRLYPTVPYVGRKLQEDVDHNGTVIPKDTNIYLFFYGMHRREDLFPDADKFDPGRFETGKASSHPFSFLPFSAGPRMCLGYKYAMYQGKCVLSRLLMNFEALPSAIKYEIKLHATISLVASPEILIQLKERRLN